MTEKPKGPVRGPHQARHYWPPLNSWLANPLTECGMSGMAWLKTSARASFVINIIVGMIEEQSIIVPVSPTRNA